MIEKEENYNKEHYGNYSKKDYDEHYDRDYKNDKYRHKRKKESFMGEIFDIFGGD